MREREYAALPQVREHVVDVSSITRKRQIVLFRSAVSQVKESMLFRSAESQRERMHVIQIRSIISESVSQAKEREREHVVQVSRITTRENARYSDQEYHKRKCITSERERERESMLFKSVYQMESACCSCQCINRSEHAVQVTRQVSKRGHVAYVRASKESGCVKTLKEVSLLFMSEQQ